MKLSRYRLCNIYVCTIGTCTLTFSQSRYGICTVSVRKIDNQISLGTENRQQKARVGESVRHESVRPNQRTLYQNAFVSMFVIELRFLHWAGINTTIKQKRSTCRLGAQMWGCFMFLLSTTFLVLKLWYLLHSSFQHNDLKSCFSNTIRIRDWKYLNWMYSDYTYATVQVPAPIANASSGIDPAVALNVELVILQDVTNVTWALALISLILTIVISIFYAAKGSKRGNKRARLSNKVYMPLIPIVLGSLVVLFEAYSLGALISVHPGDLTSRINTANTFECISSSRFSTSLNLTWATLIIYVAILVVGHAAGLCASFKREVQNVSQRPAMNDSYYANAQERPSFSDGCGPAPQKKREHSQNSDDCESDDCC
jgi:uncharacterized membrane protein (DUF485 family)